MRKREYAELQEEKRLVLEEIHAQAGQPLYSAFMRLLECLETEANEALIGCDDADNIKFKSAVATLRGVRNAARRPAPKMERPKESGRTELKDGAYT